MSSDWAASDTWDMVLYKWLLLIIFFDPKYQQFLAILKIMLCKDAGIIIIIIIAVSIMVVLCCRTRTEC